MGEYLLVIVYIIMVNLSYVSLFKLGMFSCEVGVIISDCVFVVGGVIGL